MIISSTILLLLIGGGVAWLSESVNNNAPKWVALVSVLLSSIPFLQLCDAMQANNTAKWLTEENYAWIPRLNISFHLAIDGLSALLIALTLITSVVAVLCSWKEIQTRTGFFYLNLLWTIAGVIGVFTALDLFLFFVFWEIILVPMYLMIVIWGYENRRAAALKFFIFTQAGGLLMLVSIIALVLLQYQNTGRLSFDYNDLINTVLPDTIAFWIMSGFLIAFAVKLPIVPFHNWQPDSYAQAPTGASILLAAVLSKMGGYGIIRFVLPLFPVSAVDIAPYAVALAVMTIVYGAVLAFAQHDLKRVIAYSSISHMGFVLLGCFAVTTLAWQGAVVQMLAHGISTAGLFALAGFIHSRYKTSDLNKLGGLWQTAPKLGASGLFFVAASLGMPGLGNFVGEFLVLAGSFKHYPALTAVAAIGLILSAIYSLTIAQKTFFGPLKLEKCIDLGAREIAIMLGLAAILIFMGIHPQPLLDLAQQSLDHFPIPLEPVNQQTGAHP